MKIKFLMNMLNNDLDEEVKVVKQTDNEIYYIDGLGRWCYLLKSEEGISFEYLEEE